MQSKNIYTFYAEVFTAVFINAADLFIRLDLKNTDDVVSEYIYLL